MLLCAWPPTSAVAQESAPPAQAGHAQAGSQQTPQTPAAPAGTALQDIGDYYRRWRKKPPPSEEKQSKGLARAIVPIAGSKPSTGFLVGVGGTLEKPLGDLDDTYVSSVLLSGWVSTKKQYAIQFRPTLFGSRNGWLLSGDNDFRQAGQETYGLGTSAPASAEVALRYGAVKFIDTYYRRVGRRVYVGAGLVYQRQSDVEPLDDEDADWEQQPYFRYSTQAGFDPAGQTAAGLSVGVRRDGRDSISDPDRGTFAEATYRAHMADFLGGDSTWQRLSLDLRGYRTLTPNARQKIAVWMYGDFVAHGTAPYLSLPATGTDPMGRSGRGFAEGRFRGERLVYGEIEYRRSFTRDGVVGMVAFLNATTVGSTFTQERLFDRVAIGGGFGLRARLQKRSRTNVCLDFGWGRDGFGGVYIALAEAF